MKITDMDAEDSCIFIPNLLLLDVGQWADESATADTDTGAESLASTKERAKIGRSVHRFFLALLFSETES